jgi:hypothetical protein
MWDGGSKMFKLSTGPGGLGLSCSEKGLTLAGVPLLRRDERGFIPRPQAEIQQLINRAYGTGADTISVMRGLSVVARALNSGEMARAMVAAVQLRLPELDWNGAVRIAHAEDVLAKYSSDQPRDWHGRWTCEGDGDGPEALIPVAFIPGTQARPDRPVSAPAASVAAAPESAASAKPANVGTGGDVSAADTQPDLSLHDWVKLPPGERIDEIGDLLEWIVNAKPEDEQALRAEIRRLYNDVGDTTGGSLLNALLSNVLRRWPLNATARRELLEAYERFTRHDPVEAGRINLLFGLLAPVAAARLAARAALEGAEAATAAADAEVAAGASTSRIWKLGWAARGRIINRTLGAGLGDTFATIDDFSKGIATSIKSINLNAATYQNAARLLARINTYVDQVAEYEGGELGRDVVKAEEITGRALNLAIPEGSVSAAQKAAIDAARARAKRLGVDLIITPF